MTPRILAPRALAWLRLSSTARRRLPPSQAVAILGERLGAFSGTSFEVDSAEEQRKRIKASWLTDTSVPMQSATSVLPTPDRLDAELDRGCARAQAVDSETGDPLVPSDRRDARHRPEQAALVKA